MFPSLYAIVEAVWLKGTELALAEMLADSGVELIQYRNKRIPSRDLFQISRNLVVSLGSRSRLIVNDRPDIASLAGAGGVHVGREDVSVEDARNICGRDRWVGVSTHTLAQVREATSTSADYIAVGPVFSTATKENPEPVVGVELIRRARALTDKPLVAIGGITLERAEEVYRSGADSLAVSKDLLAAENPAQRAREYLSLAAGVLSNRRGAGS